MRITSKGQVTIPQEIRERFGLLPETEVDFVVKRNSVHLVKAKQPRRASRGQAIVSRLKGSATIRMSTDEILALTRK
jgi:AbrB family looped-hinge helix DNA binding protein